MKRKLKKTKSLKRLYFDYAASTPIDGAVLQEMEPYFSLRFGNPGSLHSLGQEAMAGVDLAREKIMRALELKEPEGFREVIFTGSATEANNLALRGVLKNTSIKNPRIIVSQVEHESILETARVLEREGTDVVYMPVDSEGRIDLTALQTLLTKETILVSVMYANNEVGTIQPIKQAVSIVKKQNPNILFHTDAVQAFQYLNCNPKDLGVDLMTISAHKIYGPKGVGVFYRRTDNRLLSPIISGGGQEFGFRSGTENVPAIVGFGKAAELFSYSRELEDKESKRVVKLKEYFWKELKKIYPKAQRNGCQLSVTSCESLPNILNIYFPDHLASDLIIKLDMAGIAVSSGAACSIRSSKPSHVLRAMGLPMERILRSVRFSFGRHTTLEHIKEGLRRLKKL